MVQSIRSMPAYEVTRITLPCFAPCSGKLIKSARLVVRRGWIRGGGGGPIVDFMRSVVPLKKDPGYPASALGSVAQKNCKSRTQIRLASAIDSYERRSACPCVAVRSACPSLACRVRTSPVLGTGAVSSVPLIALSTLFTPCRAIHLSRPACCTKQTSEIRLCKGQDCLLHTGWCGVADGRLVPGGPLGG